MSRSLEKLNTLAAYSTTGGNDGFVHIRFTPEMAARFVSHLQSRGNEPFIHSFAVKELEIDSDGVPIVPEDIDG